MLEQVFASAVSVILGLASGIIGSFIGFTLWPRWRRDKIWSALRVVANKGTADGAYWCRVINGSPFTMGKAVAYITIDHVEDDIINSPTGRTAHMTPKHRMI